MLWLWMIAILVVLLLATGFWVDHRRGNDQWRASGSSPHGGDPESKFFNRYGGN